ncbi:MAG: hypothetical protein LW878_03825 [Proteobacteria bacterium]|nr:hypothetical protein [Pseudomonadota bacterium]
MKNFILFSALTLSLQASAQDVSSEELLNELEPDVSELLLDAPTGDETFSQKPATPATTPVAEEAAKIQEPLLPELTPEEAPAPIVAEPEVERPIPPPSRDSSFAVRGLVAENTSQQEVKQEDGKYNPRTGHWIGTIGFETTAYTLPFNFTGAKKTFKEEDRRLTGGRLGFGREAYLGAGFLVNARLEGYYMGTLFNSLETASPEFTDVTVAATKDTGQMFGGDAIGHFGWMFDYNTKNPFLGEMAYMAFELFVEAGVGRGRAINGKSYFFKATTNEQYKVTFEDDFSTQIVSAGFNIHSRSSGSFLYVKASQVTQSITERKVRGSTGSIAAPTEIKETLTNPDSDPLTVFSVGGGFKF